MSKHDEKNLYPQPRPQAACPPQTGAHAELKESLDRLGKVEQPHRPSQLDEALGTVHGLTDTLESHVSRLEDALDEHLLPEPEPDGAKDYPQPRDDNRTTKAREVDAANSRLQRLCRRLESIMNRLEC